VAGGQDSDGAIDFIEGDRVVRSGDDDALVPGLGGLSRGLSRAEKGQEQQERRAL
jgi:hypothetical protein